MKTMLWLLGSFCMFIGLFLSLAGNPEYSTFMFAWGVGAMIVFGTLAALFPER